MAYNKDGKSDSPMKRRGGRSRKRDTSLREEKSFREESQETVQNIRELSQ